MNEAECEGREMMSNIAVHNGAWVLVGDGRRALFLYNHGDPDLLDLRVIDARVDENPSAHEQGTDAPGRYASRGGPSIPLPITSLTGQ